MKVILFVSVFFLLSCQKTYVDYVNPLVGSNERELNGFNHRGKQTDRGKTYPSVGVPFGMNNWTPQTLGFEKKGNPPYFYKDSTIQGFRNSHYVNGSAVRDYGTFTIMPVSGTLITNNIERASSFKHENELATPSYYSVYLDRYHVQVELTGLSRSGMLKLHFENEDDHYLVIEPNSDTGKGYVEVIPERNEIIGYNPVQRIYQGSGKQAGFSGYFSIVIDQPIEDYGVWNSDGILQGGRKSNGSKSIGAYVKIPSGKNTLQVKMGSSFVSIENARENIQAEISHWNFEKVKDEAENEWNNILSKIQIVKGSEYNKAKFYTAMYMAHLLPRVFSDVDGSYIGFDGDEQLRQVDDHDYYTDFSLWDTYRAVHPLFTIIQPERNIDMIRSFILKGEQGGWLPIFPLYNNYTSAMIGDHGLSLIGDAFIKGQNDFDINTAYELMYKNATQYNNDEGSYIDGKGRRALDSYLENGFIPLEDKVLGAFHQREQVSRTLEYAYDDYVLAQVAKKLGKNEDYQGLLKRSKNYRNVFDPTSGFIRGRYVSGNWIEPFNPFDYGHSRLDTGNYFVTEGTPAQFTWYVPQDVRGLIEMMGGNQSFIGKLDQLFEGDHYWHGNEPCHHIPYLYPYAGEPWKTQKLVHEIAKKEYDVSPDGLCGNDDAGQMSAWLIFSMMGFYPVCPGMPYYVIGSPMFEEVKIKVDMKKNFTIKAVNYAEDNIYIQSSQLNGMPLDRSFIWHEEIMNGGELIFVMGNTPNKEWGVCDDCRPPTIK